MVYELDVSFYKLVVSCLRGIWVTQMYAFVRIQLNSLCQK